ncbi:expressed unknown protein [Seminavis robusta]|uniref:Uncharacterized protein n=1 Tax=Seminavis robusta TaxID=568900 RepID=A0A9N8ELX9_9STRA|nr:expressed unknown protein [Seminavis robusta]|eukprot:Sro1186_g250411.1  (141) ;mRNA; f:33147-33569
MARPWRRPVVVSSSSSSFGCHQLRQGNGSSTDRSAIETGHDSIPCSALANTTGEWKSKSPRKRRLSSPDSARPPPHDIRLFSRPALLLGISQPRVVTAGMIDIQTVYQELLETHGDSSVAATSCQIGSSAVKIGGAEQPP